MSSLTDRPPPPGLVFRNWRSRDVEALCRYANNKNIWLCLLDRFPHPYTRRDAERWIDLNNATLSPPLNVLRLDINFLPSLEPLPKTSTTAAMSSIR